MKKKFCRFFIAALSLSLLSCDKEFDENSSITMNHKSINGVKVHDGRLKFDNIEVLRTIFAENIEKSEEQMASEMKDFFYQGFVSLRPIVTEENELDMVAVYDPLIKATPEREDKYDVFDDIENLIGDDTFAAMLNWQGEIAVGDYIYKYTDVGLFTVQESKYNQLLDFLDHHHISPLPAEPTEPGNGQLLLQQLGPGTPTQNYCGMEWQIDTSLMLNSVDPDCIPYVPTTTAYSQTDGAFYADPDFKKFATALVDCGEPDSGLFGDLFGDNYKCIDKYQNRRRVKTKAYNYDYVLVFHAGAKVKHQFKGLLWRKEEQPELRLVVEAAQFEYDLTSIFAFNNNNYYYINNKEIIYNPDSSTYTQTSFNQSDLPQMFKSDLSINLPRTGINQLDSMLQNGLNNATEATELNKYFYGQLYSQTESILGGYLSQFQTPNTRTFLAANPTFGKVIIQKSAYDTALNSDERSKTFDFGGGICWNTNTSGDGYPTPCPQQLAPKNFKVKILAGSKDGNGNWHGSKFSVDIN